MSNETIHELTELKVAHYREQFEKSVIELEMRLYRLEVDEPGQSFQKLVRFLWTLPNEELVQIVHPGYGFENAPYDLATMNFLFHMLSHAMTDDGDMEMIKVEGHMPMILFNINRHDGQDDIIQSNIQERLKSTTLAKPGIQYAYSFIDTVGEFTSEVLQHRANRENKREENRKRREEALSRWAHK